MLRKFRLLGILVLFGFLFGCGGGGTSKGAGSAIFNVAPYIGEWFGPVHGPNVNNIANFRFIIGPYGGVIDPKPDPNCPKGIVGKIISSNPFKWTASFECFVGGLGVCRVTETGTMQLSGGNRITGNYKQQGECGLSNLPINRSGDFSYLKQD